MVSIDEVLVEVDKPISELGGKLIVDKNDLVMKVSV